MKYSIVLMIASLFLAVLACGLPDINSIVPQSISGSGNVVTRDEEITGFDKFDISTSFNAVVNRGDDYQVLIRIDENLVDRLLVEKTGSTLKIGLKPGTSVEGNVVHEAEISMPVLTGIELSGASDAEISGFTSSNSLTIDLSGASSLQGDIQAGDTTMDASGSSDARLSGSADSLNLDASGASDVDLSEFFVVDANLDVSGASSVTVNLSGRLDVDASGASDVTYLGNPTLGNINTSGSSDIKSR
jgi:hypothetical protein